MVKVQVITSPSGEKMVVLSKADFDALLERLEELSDVAIYDERKAELKDTEFLSAEASMAALRPQTLERK
jgi:hypothetical protein